MNYVLYYWDAPFRGNFVQLLLEEIGVKYRRANATEVYPHRRLKIRYPGMAPPILYDCKEKKYLSQMPAIVMYLARKHKFLPKDVFLQTLTLRLVLDANDILMDITNYNGLKMWMREEWKDFRKNRLAFWMKIFERTAELNGLKETKGFFFGTRVTAADIVIAALWGTMTRCLPELKVDLEKHAPRISSLCKRVESRKQIKALLEEQESEWGTLYCGGQIEKSIRKMLAS